MDQAVEGADAVHSVSVWTSPDGRQIVVPDQFADVKIAKSGLPDKRSAKYEAFMTWVKSVESAPEIPPDGSSLINRPRHGRPPKVAAVELPAVVAADADPAQTRAQAHALRIWEGQSPDVPIEERVARIVAGLQEQGLPLSITLPHDDAARYLESHK